MSRSLKVGKRRLDRFSEKVKNGTLAWKVGDLGSHPVQPRASHFDCWGLILHLCGWRVHKVRHSSVDLLPSASQTLLS